MILSIIDVFKNIDIGAETLNTLVMVVLSTLFAYIIGLPLGILVVFTEKDGLMPNQICNKILGFIINLGRSIPFLILLVTLIPFTRFIVGTSMGVKGAIVPLVIGSIPFVARLVENSLKEIDKGVVDAAKTMGANKWQIITKVYLVEAIPSLIRGVSITMIMLVGYTAMTGAVGGPGLGAIAITEGYYKSNTEAMLVILLMIILLVEFIQIIFDLLVKRIDKKR